MIADGNQQVRELFGKCQKSISALGDENRQAVIIALMEGPQDGMRVGEIKEQSHLSQPAVSHHLQILLNANLLTVNKVGTMNYYKLNPRPTEIQAIHDLTGIILQCLAESNESLKE